MTGTEIVIREADLDPKRFIVLHPIVAIDTDQRSPLLAESWAAVKIQPDTVDTYHDFRFANAKDGNHALTAVALGKIAAAAGIRWITEDCRIEQRDRRADGHIYIAFKATGAVRQPNGEWFLVPAHADLDTAGELEELIDTKVRKWRRDTKARPGTYPAAEVMAQIQDDAKRDIIQIRDFALPLVETKGQNRVIRKLLSLAQVYHSSELAKPFAVPRLIYRPDLVDARSLDAATAEGRRAMDEVFGTPTALGPGASSPDTAPRPEQAVAPDGRKSSGTQGGSRAAEGSTTRRRKAPEPEPAVANQPEAGSGPSPTEDGPQSGVVRHPYASAVAGDITNPCLTCGWAFEWAGHKGEPVVMAPAEQGKLG
jgi:hypothetical protein